MKKLEWKDAFCDAQLALNAAPKDKVLAQHWNDLQQGVQAAQASSDDAVRHSVAPLMQQEGPNAKMPAFDMNHVQVFMDIEMGQEGSEVFYKGRVVMELFQEMLPKTVENFRQLCTGEL